MTLLSKTTHIRFIHDTDAAMDAMPTMTEQHDSVGGPLDGEITTIAQVNYLDEVGGSIGQNSPIVRDAISGKPTALCNAFRCSGCGKFHALTHMAQPVEPAVSQPAADGAADTIRVGICENCEKKGRSKRILKAIGRVLIAPFLPAPADIAPTPPPLPPPPVPPPEASVRHNNRRTSYPGNTVIICLIAFNILTASFVKATVSFPAPFHETTTQLKGNTMQNQPKINPRDIQLLLNDAILYGVDNPAISDMGARCFKRLSDASEKGLVINSSDFTALKSIVERAKKIMLPMDYRLAFVKSPPPEVISIGDIKPFTLLDGITEVALDFIDMPEQIRNTGRSGSTKTTGACAILDKSIEAGKSIIVIDSKGEGQFDYFCAKYPGKVLKFRVGRSNQPFFNIWQYIRRIRGYFLLITQRKDSKIVLDAAEEQSEKQNALSGAKAITHTQLMNNIAGGTTPAGFPHIPNDFRRSMFSVFYDIQRSALYPSIRCQCGYSLREIVAKGYSAIIDTSAIAGSIEEELLICSLLSALRHEIISDPDLSSRRGTLVIFYIDECTYLAAASRVLTGLPSLVHLATLVRSSGVVLFCTYNSISIVHPVLNAAAFWIITQISNGEDLRTGQRMWSLSDLQTKALSTLPKGVAVMRMGNRYTDLFLVAYPKIPDPRKMSDAEIDANNAPILANLAAIVPEDYRSITRVQTPAVSPASAPATASATALDNDYLVILHDLAKRPFVNVTERSASIQLPSGTILNFKSLKAALDTLGNKYNYCRPLAVQLTVRGSPSELWYLTQDGHQVIGSLFKPSRGDYQHDLAQKLLRHILKQNLHLDATIEMVLPGTSKPVDLGVICPQTGMKIAVEIPISTFSTEPDQVEKDSAAGWDRVIEACMNRADLKKLKAEFAKKNYPANPRVAFCLPADLRSAKSLQDIFDNPNFRATS